MTSQLPDLVSVSLTEFLAQEFPPREKILTPIIPSQGLVMLYARRGIGKTHVAISIAIAVASGTSTMGGKWIADRPRKVLFVDGEMSASLLQEWVSALAGDTKEAVGDYLRFITPDIQEAGIPDLATSEGQRLIKKHLDGVELLILDNLSSLVRSGKENEAEDWAPVQEWLLRLRRNGISVLMVHHANKGGKQRGTSKREDLLDTIITLKPMMDYEQREGSKFTVQYEKARDFFGDAAAPFEASLTSNGDAEFWTIAEGDARIIALIHELASAGMTQRDIGKEVGWSAAKVNRALNRQ